MTVEEEVAAWLDGYIDATQLSDRAREYLGWIGERLPR